MKKLQRYLVLVFLLLFITACTNSAATTAFEIDGLWSMTVTITESSKDGPKLGEKASVDVILETRANKFSIKDTKGVERYSGTRTGNAISASGKEGLATLSITGSFSSQDLFSGNGTAIHPTKGTVKYSLVMTKK